MRSSLPFRCFPLLTRVKIGKKKAKKLKTSILEKIWIWLGTPNSAFFDPSRWFWGLRAHFQGWGIHFWGFQAILWSKKKNFIFRVETMAFFSAFSVFWPPFQKFHLRNWSNSYWTLITHLPIRFCENFWISWIAKPITLASKIWQVGTGLFSKSNPAPIFFFQKSKIGVESWVHTKFQVKNPKT